MPLLHNARSSPVRSCNPRSPSEFGPQSPGPAQSPRWEPSPLLGGVNEAAELWAGGQLRRDARPGIAELPLLRVPLRRNGQAVLQPHQADGGIVGRFDDDAVSLPVIGHAPKRHANPVTAVCNQTKGFDGFVLDGKGNPLVHRHHQPVCWLSHKGIGITPRAGQGPIPNQAEGELRLGHLEHNARFQDQPDGTRRSPRSISLDSKRASVTATSAGTARWVQRSPVRRSSTESVALEVFTLTTKAAFVSAS